MAATASASFPAAAPAPGDDPGFLSCVDRVTAGMAFRFRPARVCVIRVRRWFDHRWLGFSGKGRVAFDSPFLSHPGVALDPFRAEQLTFPPFAPARIASEQHWARRADGDYQPVEAGFRVHRRERLRSATNLHRRVVDFSRSGLFVWFSSESAANRRGSVMVYSVCDGVALPWFVSLTPGDAAERWAIDVVAGLGRAEVVELLAHPPGVRG